MSRSILKILSVVIFLGAAFGTAWWFLQRDAQTEVTDQSMMAQLRDGKIGEAATLYGKILESPGSSPEVISNATKDNITLYSITNTYSTSDIIESIRALKRLIADEGIDLEVRADNISALARLYRLSMFNDEVSKELFSEEPYASLLVASSSVISLQNLYGLSFKTFPTPRAAMSMASFYTDRLLGDYKSKEEQLDYYIQRTKFYLQQAESLSAEKLSADGNSYLLSPAYASYLIDRAFTIGGLAVVVGTPYTDLYKDAYEELLAFLLDVDHAVFKTYIGGTRWHYAVFLSVMGEPSEMVKRELDAAADAYAARPSLEFENMVRTYTRRPELLSINFAVRKLFEIAPLSPKFSAFLDQIRN
jgi:hypothetical protein